ncbi:A-kinase anchor protein 6 isoform X2 [Clupea harengus]|uniref:A-kinase anchor protein 6 isoform X2 n=1 Tax=Clupea harengus TaxID=7950 RepID=A0A6P8GL58_CLUHA|nr:A-kinase anchor protein 6 isoform X2 [Clupea harengus]
MNVAVSPMASEAASPMITSVTPTLEPSPREEEPSPAETSSSNGAAEMHAAQVSYPGRSRYQKPPPLHTGADWKVVLHLPEIETWLRATTDRVRDLTHYVHQDSQNKHVDVHLVQLKDICEDISDHVEQIHALLETEFSLKLLSYSVNIIVDIRSVQLLWHQLRVSVLVLKERLLQGLQDSNGNYTRQTDILQAFSQDHDETRLDALTEEDDSGQLTIKCSRDYFSLDCGITAYELSDYSPSEDAEGHGRGSEPRSLYPELERDLPELLQSVDLLTIAAKQLSSSKQSLSGETSTEQPSTSTEGQNASSRKPPVTGDSTSAPTMQCGNPQGESALSKRHLQGSFSNKVSPTQPSLPKRAMFLEGDADANMQRSTLPNTLQFQADLSRSTPSLLDPPDRSKFWLDLDSVYPGNARHSYESLNAMNKRNLLASRESTYQRPPVPGAAHIPLQRSSSEAGQGGPKLDHTASTSPPKDQVPQTGQYTHSDSDSPLPVSPDINPSDFEHCEDLSSSSPEVPPLSTKASLLIVSRTGTRISREDPSPNEEHWYGSDEFLALPSQLRKTEMLAMKLESLAKVLPQRLTQEPIQDVDDWELTEANQDWEGCSSSSSPQPPLISILAYKKPFLGRLSPTSSSDIAPSLDESIESGPLSDLLSEDELGWGASEARRRGTFATSSPAPKLEAQCKPVIQQLLEDIQHQDNYQDIWGKIEGFVSKLDEFICWLTEALETTENWTPPKAEAESLKLYLETHLSFKMSVDSHSSLKERVLEEGRQLLEVISSHKSGLRDMLQMIAHQWQELQRQVRRQHGWMLRALDLLKAQVLARETSQGWQPRPPSPKGEVLKSHMEAQKDILEQMTLKLKNQRFCPAAKGTRELAQMSKNNSVQEFESEYQELWDWLMDMESIVTDSHDLMMSEEQQQHLYKGNSVEMAMWLPKKTQLLGWAESLQRSGTELPPDFEQRLIVLKNKWDQLERTLGERVGNGGGSPDPRALLSPGTKGMLGQLEGKIKELKRWLRDTELFIFNLCLRQDEELQQAHTQLQQFKSLCMEVRGRRRGMASVLRLCQRLLEEPDQARGGSGSDPDAERDGLQLLAVNLERRWEAIVMQTLQWQTRLQRELGREQVPGNLLEPSLMDLRCPAEDSWEWDEMDMTIVNVESREDCVDKQNPACELALGSLGEILDSPEPRPGVTQRRTTLGGLETNPVSSSSSRPCGTYQVYSVHNVELYQQPPFPSTKTSPAKARGKQQPLLKSLSKDSSFSSVESLPDILGGLLGVKQALGKESARRSESESGIVSEGDTETTANSDICLHYQGDGSRVSIMLSPADRGGGSPEVDRVSDEDIDRILERANKCAEYECEEAMMLGKEQKVRASRKKREESGEGRRRHRRDPVDILLNGHGYTPDLDRERRGDSGTCDNDASSSDGKPRRELTHLSQGSSLESLYTAGELFPSSKDGLHRSTSLESWLAPCKSPEDAGSQCSLRDLSLGGSGEPPAAAGELSRRTLELLKRLENIQTPLAQQMTRSISDITLQSSSLRLASRGPRSSGAASSSVNESSAASMTELSGTEDSSVASEDMAVLRNRLAPPNSNASFRKHCHRNRHQGVLQGGAGAAPMVGGDDVDANISMVVNVSCTSACTDDDEDDSDLLSSSTLTLTEEELGIKDDDDSSVTSEEEDYNEGAFTLGLEYMKNEFQNWDKAGRSQARNERNEADLEDELQCGTAPQDVPSLNRAPVTANNERHFLNRSTLKLLETHSNAKNEGMRQQDVETNRKAATRNYISQFVDDMENGNVDNSHLKGKDEDDELLREEGSLFTKKGESFKDCYALNPAGGQSRGMVTAISPSSCELLSLQTKESSLESQLKGEIPCHSSSRPSPAISPMEDCVGSPHGMLGTLHGNNCLQQQQQQQHFCYLNNIRDAQREDIPSPDPPCCVHPIFPSAGDSEKGENVHDFVMEIIDLTSALKSKELQPDATAGEQERSSSPTSPSAMASQIRDKVLEHSHRGLQLRKGDFYSYLSLSSHDSDCGEVSVCVEDKSTTPVLSRTPDIICDEEPLFEACTEEVYLGPPLCYSMSVTKRPRRRNTTDSRLPIPVPHQARLPPPSPPLPYDEYQKAHGISPGSAAASQPEDYNEAPYLNPLPCETPIDTVECFADTKMLESNISPVMTKIRVSCSSTNPLKAEGGLCINPKINCPAIRRADRDEKGPASHWMKQKNVRKGRSSLQEAKANHKQSPRSACSSGVVGVCKPAQGGAARASDSSSGLRTGTTRPQVRRQSGSLVAPVTKP